MVLVVVLALGLFGGKMGLGGDKDAYSVVYLTTGEVYVGHLSTFPDFALKDGYILQVAKDPADPTKNSFQLQPLKDALWATDKLVLNKKNVVFYGELMSDSVIGKKLAEQKK